MIRKRLLGFNDRHMIRKRLLGSNLATFIPGQHNFNLDSKDSLSQEDVSASHVNIIVDWVSGVDHQTINELHGLGSLSSQLAADHNLATLSSGLHDETEDTIACSSDSKTSNELVSERLSLSNGTQTTGGNLLSIELDGSLWEVKSLLNKTGQFSDSSSLFSENILGSGGHDDDLGSGWSHTDLNTGVTILGQLPGEELVELSLEDTILNKLSLLGHLCRHSTLSCRSESSKY